jgi:hypothetical protein
MSPASRATRVPVSKAVRSGVVELRASGAASSSDRKNSEEINISEEG